MVKHKQLGNYLALKKVSDHHSSPAQLHHEVNLLKDCNHPGIPKIIDVVEEEFLYVIEEYISGPSLGEVLSNSISLHQFLSISGQLISIINYLHNLEDEPILYLDLKPEHIIVCKGQVYLLDYGLAQKCINGKVNNVYWGTEEYSSPEVKETHCATKQSDVYSLGKIMETMMKKTTARFYWEKVRMYQLNKVINNCVEPREDLRLESVKDIWDEMNKTERRWRDILRKKQFISKTTVAVIGTHHGVGTTHVATGLTQCCNLSGMSGIYVEHTASQWLRQSSISERTANKGRDKTKDLIRTGHFVGIPAYGPFYAPSLPETGIFFRDLGVLWEGFYPEAYDKVIVVLGSRFWEEEKTLETIRNYKDKENCIFVCSGAASYRVRQLAERSGQTIFLWNYDMDVFRLSREKLRVINRLLRKDSYA